MQYAVDAHGSRILAEPGLRAMCPVCGAPVIAKCGDILAWHWSHLTRDCDPWYEPESAWHREWKECFPTEWREVVIGNHRADLKTPKGVVEFQASCISSTEIQERESFYGRMIWVVKAEEFTWERKLSPVANSHYLAARIPEPRSSHGFLNLLGPDLASQQLKLERKKAEEECMLKHRKWRESDLEIWNKSWDKDPMYIWKWPRKSWSFANKKIYFDRGDSLFAVKWMSSDCKIIKGNFMSKPQFISVLRGRIPV